MENLDNIQEGQIIENEDIQTSFNTDDIEELGGTVVDDLCSLDDYIPDVDDEEE